MNTDTSHPAFSTGVLVIAAVALLIALNRLVVSVNIS